MNNSWVGLKKNLNSTLLIIISFCEPSLVRALPLPHLFNFTPFREFNLKFVTFCLYLPIIADSFKKGDDDDTGGVLH